MRRSNSVPEQTANSVTDSTSQSLRDALSDVLKSGRRQITELLELITLEARYSGLMLGVVLAMAVMAVLAVFSMWGLFLAATVLSLLASGWSFIASLVVLAVANGMMLGLAVWLMHRAIVRIGFAGTRQVLGLDESDVSK